MRARHLTPPLPKISRHSKFFLPLNSPPVLPDTITMSELAVLDISESEARLLELMVPQSIVPDCADVAYRGKYNPRMHASLCRMKCLGLSDSEAANAVGVTPQTVKLWRNRYPALAVQMNESSGLAVVYASSVVHRLMAGDGPTAFRAAKFFLDTHTESYKTKKRVEVTIERAETMRQIQQDVYGITWKAPSLAPDRVLDAETEDVQPAAALAELGVDISPPPEPPVMPSRVPPISPGSAPPARPPLFDFSGPGDDVVSLEDL